VLRDRELGFMVRVSNHSGVSSTSFKDTFMCLNADSGRYADALISSIEYL